MAMNGIKVDKIELSYIVKPGKKGVSYYFNIPTQYINDGHIDPNATYRLSLQKIIIEDHLVEKN